MPLIRKPPESRPAGAAEPASVLTALTNGSDEERWAAARAAAELPGGVQALGATLAREPNVRVREAILTALARIDTFESAELILPQLRADDAQLRTAALDALRAMKHLGPHLPRLLADRDPDVRLLACELLRNRPAEEASRLLCGLLDAESEANVCASAVEVLAEVGGAESLPTLERCAERFRGTAFLEFAIKLTADRIRSSPRIRA